MSSERKLLLIFSSSCRDDFREEIIADILLSVQRYTFYNLFCSGPTIFVQVYKLFLAHLLLGILYRHLITMSVSRWDLRHWLTLPHKILSEDATSKEGAANKLYVVPLGCMIAGDVCVAGLNLDLQQPYVVIGIFFPGLAQSKNATQCRT